MKENDPKEHNVEIRKMMTSEDFLDFCNVYLVFTLDPYNERYTVNDLKNEFSFLVNEGAVYGYYENGKCVGIVTYNKKELYNHPVNFDPEKRVAYLSDVAVLPKHRNKGIGTALMEHVVDEVRKDGYEIIYMRTLQQGKSMSFNIAVRIGFELREETEVVEHARISRNRDTKDLRIFLDKIL